MKLLYAMFTIANAAFKRSLKKSETITPHLCSHELQDDVLISHHLHYLDEESLESSVEPYSYEIIGDIATMIEMSMVEVDSDGFGWEDEWDIGSRKGKEHYI